MARKTYEQLRAEGCLCGTDRGFDCPIHTEYGDNRGLRAYFEAGMPLGFPMEATCGICGADGLMYPNIEIDDPDGSGEYKPTLVCPRCSGPSCERRLVAEAESVGHKLNGERIFGAVV